MSISPILNLVLAALSAVILLSGCSHLKDFIGKVKLPGQQRQTGQGTVSAGQIADGSIPDLAGDWVIAYTVGDDIRKAKMQLRQEGPYFAGEGTDDGTGRPFAVDEGQMDGGNIAFYKRYGEANAPPPVEYAGRLEMVADSNYTGPYMSGQYAVSVNGKAVSGQWEAQLRESRPPSYTASSGAGGREPQTSPQEVLRSATETRPEKAPHLSGKWNVAYEYDFKTIKGMMYLEQNKGTLRGHGIDDNTNERFTIERGWYSYPKITLIRKYVKGKNAAASRETTFKGEVSWVKDKSYNGPYIQGKTQGGGLWEAELMR